MCLPHNSNEFSTISIVEEKTKLGEGYLKYKEKIPHLSRSHEFFCTHLQFSEIALDWIEVNNWKMSWVVLSVVM